MTSWRAQQEKNEAVRRKAAAIEEEQEDGPLPPAAMDWMIANKHLDEVQVKLNRNGCSDEDLASNKVWILAQEGIAAGRLYEAQPNVFKYTRKHIAAMEYDYQERLKRGEAHWPTADGTNAFKKIDITVGKK